MSDLVVGTIVGVCLALLAASVFDGSPRVSVHIDAKHNVICYVTRSNMTCLPYYDEGTHLEVFQP